MLVVTAAVEQVVQLFGRLIAELRVIFAARRVRFERVDADAETSPGSREVDHKPKSPHERRVYVALLVGRETHRAAHLLDLLDEIDDVDVRVAVV